MTVALNLTAEELRVLACLVEKSHTTPDQYPLSSNAITTACNQKSSRDPVVDYPIKLVDQTLQLLRAAGWVRMIRAFGNRTFKHKHVVDEVLGLTTPEMAVLAVLALRGPQSPGELKTRTERYHHFDDLADVERTLVALRDRIPQLVHNIGRSPGQSQDRWIQLLGPVDPAVDPTDIGVPPPIQAPQPADPVAASAASVPAPVTVTQSPSPSPSIATPTPTGDAAPATVIRSDSAPPPRSVVDAGSEAVPVIDGSPSNWSEPILARLGEGGVHAVHASIADHESFREMVRNIERWNGWFERFGPSIVPGRTAGDVRRAAAEGRTAVFFGFRSPSAIEDDAGLIEICHTLGVRFMQLSSDKRSLLAAGWADDEDPGLTPFGRQVIAEMNRVGMVIDLSRCGERSTLEAITCSERGVAIGNANPSWWHPAGSNKSHRVLETLTETGGMLGLTLDPDQLAGGSHCTLEDFCEMVAEAVSRYGVDHLGIGSGPVDHRWNPEAVAEGLGEVGFLPIEVDAMMGGNWLRFYDRSFGPAR